LQPDVQKLLQVQKVDQKIARLRQQADSIPREEAQRRSKLDELNKTVADQTEEKTQSDLRTRDLELSIKQSDNEIKNLEGKLGAIKNNAEYQAILFQIEAVKKERDTYEEETLVLLDKSGPLEESLLAAQEVLSAEEAVFAEFKEKSEGLLAAQEKEISEVGSGRDALLDGIQVELVEEYSRLFEVRESLAICSAENQYCQGCYTQFTVNDLAKLQGGKVIIRCSSCQRILYLAE
jgi:predicted  nucleic acid-binding Zn-ribbon protein